MTLQFSTGQLRQVIALHKKQGVLVVAKNEL